MSDKSNAMRHTGGLWQRVFREVAAEYPDCPASHLYVDVLAMEMVRAPERFDVIVTSNLFGDIITDLGAILQGGIGLACSGNIHPGRLSLFEPVHGSAPDIAGQGKANPLAAALSLAGFLGYSVGYTMLLKRSTWQNIVWGGAAGAIPPLVGWAAVTGSINGLAVILFFIVFLFLPPFSFGGSFVTLSAIFIIRFT
jgi:hypothetical protein